MPWAWMLDLCPHNLNPAIAGVTIRIGRGRSHCRRSMPGRCGPCWMPARRCGQDGDGRDLASYPWRDGVRRHAGEPGRARPGAERLRPALRPPVRTRASSRLACATAQLLRVPAVLALKSTVANRRSLLRKTTPVVPDQDVDAALSVLYGRFLCGQGASKGHLQRLASASAWHSICVLCLVCRSFAKAKALKFETRKRFVGGLA